MDPDNRVIAGGAVAVESDTIVGVGETAALLAQHPDAEHQPLHNQLLMPGLVNAHNAPSRNLLLRFCQ